MKKLLKILLCNCACLVFFTAKAQDPHFSQFYANTIYTNPAFTGTSGATKFSMNGRKQFTNVPSGIYTTTFSGDMSIKKSNGGLGFICMYDRAGSSAYTTNSASLIYSYRITVNRKLTISAALEGGFVNRNIDRNSLVFADQLETEQGIVRNTDENIPSSQRFYPNFGAGFLAYTKDFYTGIAIHNIAEPNESFINTNSRDKSNLQLRRYTIHFGMNLYTQRNVRKATIISPNILCMLQGRSTEVNLGFYARKNQVTAGLWMRQTMNNTDAVIMMVGYKFDKLSVGYSYDLGVGRSFGNIKSAHEISLQFTIKKPGNYKLNSIRHLRIPCPEL